MPYMKRGRQGSLVKKESLTITPAYYRVLGEKALSEIDDFGKHQNLDEAVLIAKIQASKYLTCVVYSEDTKGNLMERVFSIRG